MIQTKLFEDNPTLVETYSDTNHCLRQVETGDVYGSSVVDLLDHYDGDAPVSRFTYEETDELDDDEEIEDSEALAIITGEPI